jgi:hypothetical protein
MKTRIHSEIVEGFNIDVDIDPDETEPEYFDAETLEGIREGRYQWFIVKVTASREGVELATNYLGGCCYADPAEFVRDSDYYPDMVRDTISDAKTTIRKLCVAF